MNIIKDIFTNYILMSAVCAWFFAQMFKIFTGLFKNRRFSLSALIFSNGGMPSSHSASVSALAASSIIRFGFDSFECAICVMFAFVVMIDASGVRYETGEQAKILNRITRELFSGKAEEINTGLKELVGHTPFQVLVGALLGVAVAIVLGLFMV